MNVYYQKGIGMDMRYFWRSIVSLSKGMIIPALLGCWIMRSITFDNYIFYLAMIISYSAIYGLSMWFLGMNNEEKALVIQPIQKLIRRGR